MLKGKRVLVRVDFNVPVENGKVADDSKLVATLPTIEYLIRKRSKVIVVTHLGRPDGKVVPSLRVNPAAKRLGDLLGSRVDKLAGWQGIAVTKAIDEMKEGDVVMLENIRFAPEEQGNKGDFAEHLSNVADIFVLDGFAVAHRGDASVSGVAEYLPSYAGLLLEEEIKGLTRVMHRPAKPFVLIMGGLKTETKIPVIQSLLPKVDSILLGGGIVNTALAAVGYGVGGSAVDEKQLELAAWCARQVTTIMPLDAIVGDESGRHVRHVYIPRQAAPLCKKTEAMLDIGPETVRLYASYIKKAQTIVWNGAMGHFEVKPYDVGTKAIARLVAARSKGRAYGVIGGGETVQAMELVGMTDDIDLVSTGGGAMLEFLAGQKLPGIEALKKR